jgi:hypothetical protein
MSGKSKLNTLVLAPDNNDTSPNLMPVNLVVPIYADKIFLLPIYIIDIAPLILVIDCQ